MRRSLVRIYSTNDPHYLKNEGTPKINIAMAGSNPHKGIRGWPKNTRRSPNNIENCRRGWEKRRERARLQQSIVLERSTADDFRALAALKELEPQAHEID